VAWRGEYCCFIGTEYVDVYVEVVERMFQSRLVACAKQSLLGDVNNRSKAGFSLDFFLGGHSVPLGVRFGGH